MRVMDSKTEHRGELSMARIEEAELGLFIVRRMFPQIQRFREEI